MSLTDKVYETYYSVSGLARPFTMTSYRRAVREADAAYETAKVSPLADIGTAESLSILPLVDFYSIDDVPGGTEQKRFSTEPGVSYLVTVDGRRILFDVGYNRLGEHPSPLLHNMAALGLSPADIDAIVISHVHLDHVGGPQAQASRTFTLSGKHLNLRGIPAYVPAPMTHPSATIHVVKEGSKLGEIGEGLASTGPLTRAIWLTGPVSEQALLVNVKDKGTVVIIGCGHPSLSRLLERAAGLVDAPLYGVVGGLHFPVTGSRVGRGRQNIIGSGKPPWQRITKRDARTALEGLEKHAPSLVALSAHDSCDWTLGLFAGSLGSRYRRLLVGEEIVVA